MWTPHALPRLVFGTSARLLAPGLPDVLVADGRVTGWLHAGALWTRDAFGGLATLALPGGVEALLAAPGSWTAFGEDVLWRGDPATGVGALLEVPLEVEEVRPGGDWLVLVGPDGAEVVAAPGAPPVPTLDRTAREASSLAPFAAGPGLLWVSEDRVWTQGPRGVPRVLGHLPRVLGFVPGPHGSAAFLLPEGAAVLASGGALRRLRETLDFETVRFSPDGRRLLAAAPSGTVEVDLAEGRVDAAWDAALLPVGWAPGPILLDERTGTLVDASGGALLEGFEGAVPSCDGVHLVGPGGAAWDVATRERRWGGLRGGVTAVTHGTVLHLADGLIRRLDRDGRSMGEGPDPLAPDEADAAVPATDGSVVALAGLGGAVVVVRVGDGEVVARTAGEPGAHLLPAVSGVVLSGDRRAILLPQGADLGSAPVPVDAAVVVAGALVRAAGGSLWAVPLGTGAPAWRADGVDARELAAGRLLLVAEEDDLLVLDPVTGDARDRHGGVLEGTDRLFALPAPLAAASTGPGAPARLVLLDVRGRVHGVWPVSAAGVAWSARPGPGGVLVAWTRQGGLVALDVPLPLR
jgi:hypothetical protein